MKENVQSDVPEKTKKQLNKKAVSHLRMLQKRQDRVKKYFKYPKIGYAV